MAEMLEETSLENWTCEGLEDWTCEGLCCVEWCFM